jgi:hypothetical protein
VVVVVVVDNMEGKEKDEDTKKSKSDTQGGPSQNRVSNPGQDSRVH